MQHVIRLKVSWAKQRSSPENDKLNKLFKYCDHDHAEEHHKEDQNAH